MNKQVFLLAVLLAVFVRCEEPPLASGVAGGCRWAFSGAPRSPTLTISGAGAIPDYAHPLMHGDRLAPWHAHRRRIKTVIIGDSVTAIGDWAFYDCRRLTAVSVGRSVARIGGSSFAYCRGLTSLSLGVSVAAIGPDAFRACGSLTAVRLPASVRALSHYAFSDCRNLTAIRVDEGNPAYSSDGGVVFNKDRTTLVVYPAGKTGDYAIPSSVTAIGWSAFAGCRGLTAVTIPDSVRFIGDFAFHQCLGLTTVVNHSPAPQFIEGRAVFSFVDTDVCTLQVPSGAVEAYRKASGWQDFKTIAGL
ncbi:MAG: leucine-rich repeat domain-containing protein [Prevotellaceae bacterium]|nr:leucine-rich repeat domain-containing protein [Prevotellaceae bacterium]